MNRLKSTASMVRRNYERVAERFETGVSMLERRYTPLGRFTPGPFEGWRFLWQPGGARLRGDVADPGGMFVHELPVQARHAEHLVLRRTLGQVRAVTPSETKYILSVVLVYGGLLLLMRVWLRLAEIMKLHPGAKLRSLWWMLLLWATPMIVAPPLFSRDVFSYAAQGEVTTFGHISPYLYGPFISGIGSVRQSRRPALGQLPPRPTDRSSCSSTARSTGSPSTTNSGRSSGFASSRPSPSR